MKCQNCDSERILKLDAKCPDGFRARVGNDSYVHLTVDGVCSGEYIEPRICLDCGQTQGSWPFQIEDDPWVAPPAPDFFTDAKKWYDTCREHAGHGGMVCANSSEHMALGFTCHPCGKWFPIHLYRFKNTSESIPADDRILLMSAEGRRTILEKWINEALETSNEQC